MQCDADQLNRPDNLAVDIVNFGYRGIDFLLVSRTSPSFFQDGAVVTGSLGTATVIADVDGSKQLNCLLIAIRHQFYAYPQHR
ncbi:hypothetical protein CBM2592_B110006 [Cupriavidus taiwanensis]|nr:hypothetical protein CBM2592_B110006 [Cupriavidus taiwanensis]SOY98444.1 hypothetical protein CBM2591_B90006 [Cupriavidus taiwanensis]SOZ77304.1 hypothetical protein CBM2617_U10074 [Cupriavidus taiwanensis]SOZ85306.1 hypothetical protein CBM2618_B130093 [Cupriavidus taiwanensis]SOZ88727.1 hypothetical protein CBM2622_B140096 [Cupriavidus taiwanensis]